jgi:predicted dinucleotide-binding enzyme
MKIGIVGTGNMGRTLGVAWARAGHEVLFGSRDRRKAQAVAASAERASHGDFDDAARFGDVVLYTIRDVAPAAVLQRPGALSGKVLVDCNNSDIPAGFRFAMPEPSLADALAKAAPGARVVKAFNTIPHRVIELGREALAKHRISVYVASDDAAARTDVMALARDAGFVPVDGGGLPWARHLESMADFLRFQIAGQGLGVFATLSIHVVGEGSVSS